MAQASAAAGASLQMAAEELQSSNDAMLSQLLAKASGLQEPGVASGWSAVSVPLAPMARRQEEGGAHF